MAALQQARPYGAWLSAVLTAAVLLAGCAGPASQATGTSDQPSAAAAPTTLVVAFRYESLDLSPKIPEAIAGGAKALFNAFLTDKDPANVSQPFLAEALPQLNTDTWRVLPDGRMETTYRLRPNLTWHDGQPLTADDFVFAWQVYANPGLAIFRPSPQDQMVEVVAPDPRSVVVRWSLAFADADILSDNFPPLPRHILGEPFSAYLQDATARDPFINHPYWTNGYVGLGPYRLDRWEPGLALSGDAFPGYVFGRPRIDRIVARIFGDENVVMVSLMSGEIQFGSNNTLRFEHGTVLKREWESTHKGTLLWTASGAVNAIIQFRPDYQKTPALFDLRVRKALMHSIDKQALQDGLFESQGQIAHTAVSPLESFFPEAERAVTKYPYDPLRTEAFMNEAGFSKDAAGFYADAGGERFRPGFQVLAGTSFERHQAIMAETWTRAGVDTAPSVLAPAQSREVVNRHTFPGISQSLGAVNLPYGAIYSAQEIGTPANQWGGSNRGGWLSPGYEMLWTAFNTTLPRSQREGLQVQMAKMVSDELPAFVLYYDIRLTAYTDAFLRGPTATNPWWSVHEWELR